MNTMRRLLIVPLAALATLLAGATCMTIERRGPGGPWSGEITNAGDQPIASVGFVADVYDANGAKLPYQLNTQTCPTLLLPGQTGAYWVTYQKPREAGTLAQGFEYPWELRIHEGGRDNVGYIWQQGDGLLIEEVPAAPGVPLTTTTVRVTNNLPYSYLGPLSVCAVRRDGDGRLVSVAYGGNGGNSFELKPGESTMASLIFPTAETGITTRYYAAGYFAGPIPACCPALDKTAWVSVKNHAFSVMLPPGWAYESRPGVDSFVGAYAGDGVELRFDYGLYSDPLDYDDDPAYEVHEETIGGLTAKIVRPEGARGITGVFFSRVAKFSFPGDNIAFDVRLTIVGQDLTAEQQEIALQIFRSVRFAE